jgi:hypothetical protein
MMSPIHRKIDKFGLPVVEKMISMDITDDEHVPYMAVPGITVIHKVLSG